MSDTKTRVAQNGYHYTKVESRGWVLTHHLVAEKELGRRIETNKERVIFVDRDKTNLDPSNVAVVAKVKNTPPAARIARLKEKEKVLQDQLEAVRFELAELES